jgi:putative thioredoxin
VLAIEPGHEAAITALAELLVKRGAEEDKAEALALLERIPESAETRRIAALARIGVDTRDDVTDELDTLLPRVKDDDAARQRFVDLLEVMGPDDPRTASYRKQLTAQLF